MRRSPGQVRLPTLFGLLAQLAEHLTVNQGVAGSSPAGTAMFGAIDELVKSSAFHAEECEFEPPGITIASLKTALLGCVRPDISV